MRIRNGMLLLVALLLVTGLAHSQTETATLSAATGEVTLVVGETSEPLAAGAELSEGAALVLGDGAEGTITFADGAVLDAMGPARLKLVRMSPYLRRVDLSSGRINQFRIGEVTSGVHTPYETFVAVQNGTVGVHVERGRVTYNLFEGSDAKVVDLAEGQKGVTDLTPDMPYVVEREGVGRGAVPSIPTMDANSRIIKVGLRTVRLTPGDGFEVVATPTGGVTITCIVPQGEFGTVMIGLTTTFYLTTDDVLELDSSGNVVRSTAIVHSVAALDIRGIYDEAIANPGDSSPIRLK